jgi:hypothetical protein
MKSQLLAAEALKISVRSALLVSSSGTRWRKPRDRHSSLRGWQNPSHNRPEHERRYQQKQQTRPTHHYDQNHGQQNQQPAWKPLDVIVGEPSGHQYRSHPGENANSAPISGRHHQSTAAASSDTTAATPRTRRCMAAAHIRSSVSIHRTSSANSAALRWRGAAPRLFTTTGNFI